MSDVSLFEVFIIFALALILFFFRKRRPKDKEARTLGYGIVQAWALSPGLYVCNKCSAVVGDPEMHERYCPAKVPEDR